VSAAATATLPADVLPANLRRVFAEQFSPDTLRHLAAAMNAEAPELVARRRLTEEGVERLAQLMEEGRRPTIGFYRRWWR